MAYQHDLQIPKCMTTPLTLPHTAGKQLVSPGRKQGSRRVGATRIVAWAVRSSLPLCIAGRY
jgi:hypothetical protein